MHGAREHADALRADVEAVLAPMGLRLSAAKTRVVHIDEGFDFLGFHIRRIRRRDGRTVIHTYPSKHALAAVKRKIKQATARGTTWVRLVDVLRVVNPILRGWANYFRYGVSKRTFSYLGYYAWWRLIYWIRRKHPAWTWKQVRRRYYGADRITQDGVVLFNPATVTVERYLFRGGQIVTPYNDGEVDPAGARFRRTTYDDVAFVGQVSELVSLTPS